jgi:RHS repeat-associated protein
MVKTGGHNYDALRRLCNQCVFPSRYTGKERDAESGLDYFGARYYGSSMGRFMSPDDGDGGDSNPANPQSWNLYAYVQNSPLSNTDPDGHDCIYGDGNGGGYVQSGDCTSDSDNGIYVNGTVDANSFKYNSANNSSSFSYTPDGAAPGTIGTGVIQGPDLNGGFAAGSLAAGVFGSGSASTWNNAAGAVSAKGIASFYGASGAIAACIVACPAAGAAALTTGRALYYAAAGLLPAVPSAIDKLQKLGLSIPEANELIESPSTQRLVDNANSGNVNYIADVGGKLVRITTDPNGQRIISAGIVRANSITNGIANGRFTK